MRSVLADTHAFIWYITAPNKLSNLACEALDFAVSNGGSIVLASISHVEMTYLIEKGRIPKEVLSRLEQLLDIPERSFRLVPLDVSVARAMSRIPRSDVPDMPDRIIAATAVALELPLVSRDRKIRSSAVHTIW